jgi:hypothetical protein
MTEESLQKAIEAGQVVEVQPESANVYIDQPQRCTPVARLAARPSHESGLVGRWLNWPPLV